MKNVFVIYDDRKKPGYAIRGITGGNSFGNTIYKRKSLREIVEHHVEAPELEKNGIKTKFWLMDSDHIPELSAFSVKTPVVHIFSDCAVKDPAEFHLLIRKAVHIRERYIVKDHEKTAVVMFPDLDSWDEMMTDSDTPDAIRLAAEEYPQIDADAFADISGRDAFLRFITSGFEARFFNSVQGDEYNVVKTSTNIRKIHAEYKFYHLLPDRMKYWFVEPYDYKEENGTASYTMERMHMTDLAIRYVHGAISIEEFERILNDLFRFISMRTEREVDWDTFYARRKALYIDKVEQRMAELKEDIEYPMLDSMIRSGTGYDGIDAIVKKYEELYDRMIGKHKEKLVEVIGHGDLCFSNILYSAETDLMRFIDPKGAEKQDELFTDPLYDIAKLSHSICGSYDFMNSGLYEITVDEGLFLNLRIDGDNHAYIETFKKKIQEAGMDYELIRLFECSLFLSMLPLHMDRVHKVLAFVLNAIDIIGELDNSRKGNLF